MEGPPREMVGFLAVPNVEPEAVYTYKDKEENLYYFTEVAYASAVHPDALTTRPHICYMSDKLKYCGMTPELYYPMERDRNTRRWIDVPKKLKENLYSD